MVEKNKKSRKYIDFFYPDVTKLDEEHQDFLYAKDHFDAGIQNINFNDFIAEEATQYREAGNGVTYLVWNIFYDENGNEKFRDLVSYYTLTATAIPYEDRIRLDEEDALMLGKEFDIQIAGISALEIKMFAVDDKYQDLFFRYEEEELPISAWIMRSIIDMANDLIDNVVGFKALFLHSVPDAEKFYEKNGFHYIKKNMRPLYCIDSDFTPMYLSLREVYMNYED